MRTLLAAIMILTSSLACLAGTPNQNFHAKGSPRGGIYMPDKSGDKILQELIETKASKFDVRTFSDDASGLSITYNVYIPENYSAETKYPAVFFIADASCAGKPPRQSLTQGYGALVWPADCIVIVPTFTEVVIDDHDGFTLSPYGELTKKLVEYALGEYSIDTARVYATGQSMGCMTFLYLAATYPDMFTACMFVSGQWDISVLKGLMGQKFVYVASAGDEKASKGQREVLDMFMDGDNTMALYAGVDARDPKLSVNAPVTFITFKKGTTLPENASGSEHMSSFDYAYRIKDARDWLLSQTKGE